MHKNRTIYKSRNNKRKQQARKLKSQDEYHVPKTDTVDYRIINFVTVFSAIASLVKCAKCNSEISFGIVSERRLGFKISVVCDKCTPEYIPSCDFIKHSYEINRRFILATRAIGVGYKRCKKILRFDRLLAIFK